VDGWRLCLPLICPGGRLRAEFGYTVHPFNLSLLRAKRKRQGVWILQVALLESENFGGEATAYARTQEDGRRTMVNTSEILRLRDPTIRPGNRGEWKCKPVGALRSE